VIAHQDLEIVLVGVVLVEQQVTLPVDEAGRPLAGGVADVCDPGAVEGVDLVFVFLYVLI
jgi:hypothetical protein